MIKLFETMCSARPYTLQVFSVGVKMLKTNKCLIKPFPL